MKTEHQIERERMISEARGWLRDGYTTRTRVDDLMQRITRHRGAEAARRLREEMRRQYADGIGRTRHG